MKNKLEKILGFSLEATENPDFGDYSSNYALQMMGRLKERQGKDLWKTSGLELTGEVSKFGPIYEKKWGNAISLAEEMVTKLRESKELNNLVEKIEVAGPGFINFCLKKDTLVNNLMLIGSRKENYGKTDFLKNKKIVLEFTDPNPFKEFHIGHVYTNTVGESLSRLFAACGALVHRVNYQGDVGLHVAKSVWGMMQKMKDENLSLSQLSEKELSVKVKFMGEAYALGSRAYEEDQTTKDEINLLNKKIFAKDKDVLDLYNTGRKWSLEYFESIYKRLGTKFDNYYFESEVGPIGKKIVEDGLKKGIFEKSKGAVIFPGSEFGLHDRVFLNSLGLPTYEAKELGLAPEKYKDFAYDQSIIITGNEINEYFKVLIKAMSFIYSDLAEKTKHIGHGMVRLPEGKMSSRTGKIVTGESLLNEVKSVASKINKESAEKVAVAAVKYAFLKVGIGGDVIYNMNESLSLEGNSGPYLQYTVARCNSVMQKAPTFKGASLQVSQVGVNMEEMQILRSLIRFSEVIEDSAASYAPNLLCNYLYDLAQKYNSFYATHRVLSTNSARTKDEILSHNKDKIIGSDNEDFRLALTNGTGQVLKNGLKLLGMEAPEKM